MSDANPSIDVLVSLEPEELAQILLSKARQCLQNGMFYPDSVNSRVLGELRPQSISSENDIALNLAFSEAWAWLEHHILIVRATGTNGNNGWKLISRRGNQLLTKEQFYTYREAVDFPKSLLHPIIANKVWLALARGDLEDAVFLAFKAVEISVRRAGMYADTDIGMNLMRKAFDAHNGALANMSDPVAEREALSNLFAGAIGSYKNPYSHRTVRISDPREAQEMVLLASHLLGIVDSRRTKKPE